MKCLKCDGEGTLCSLEHKELDHDISCPRCEGTGEVEFYNEQELKEMCIPEFIKWMVDLSDGFEQHESFEGLEYITVPYRTVTINGFKNNLTEFPLLIHRAVEGWNKKNWNRDLKITIHPECITYLNMGFKTYSFKNYQPENLTNAECACLHCLLDIFKEKK